MIRFLKTSRKSSASGVTKQRICQHLKSNDASKTDRVQKATKNFISFTDASEFAYGAAAYIKITNETGVHVSLGDGQVASGATEVYFNPSS